MTNPIVSTKKIAHHPDGVHIITFDEGSHTYKDNFGQYYTSGTSIVGKFFEKFDAIGVSRMCAAGSNPKYAGRTAMDIRAEWSANGLRSTTEGSNVHEYGEGRIAKWDQARLPKPISPRCENLFKVVDQAVSRLNKWFVFVAAEMIVFDPELRLAGMVDLVMYDPRTGEIMILDWKTNGRELSREGFGGRTAKEPIDHLQDSDISHYSLQLSLYERLMINGNFFPGFKGFRRGIIHLLEDGAVFVKLEDYDYEIKEMIKCHVKRKTVTM